MSITKFKVVGLISFFLSIQSISYAEEISTTNTSSNQTNESTLTILDNTNDSKVIIDNAETEPSPFLEVTDYKTLALTGDRQSIDKVILNNQINQKIDGTYLSIAAAQKFNIVTFKHIMNSKPLLSVVNLNGESILFWALSRNNKEYALTIKNENQKDFAQLLLKKNSNGRFPIHNMAIYSTSLEVAKLSINEKSYSLIDNYGQSALHYAGAYSKPDFFKLLLENGFDLYLKDKSGLTPRDFAFRNFSIFNLSRIYKFFNEQDKETIKQTISKIGSSMASEYSILN